MSTEPGLIEISVKLVQTSQPSCVTLGISLSYSILHLQDGEPYTFLSSVTSELSLASFIIRKHQ